MSVSQQPAYVAWHDAPFPAAAAPQTELNRWHKDLIVVDLWVAGSLIRFASDGQYVPSVPDVFAEISRLRQVLDRLVESGVGQDMGVVQSYRDYLDLLEAAYQLFIDSAPR